MVSKSTQHARWLSRALAGLLVGAGVLTWASACHAQVQLASGGVINFVNSRSKAGPAVDLQSAEGPGLGVWGTTMSSHAHDNLTGADAGAGFTISSFIDSTAFLLSTTGAAQTQGSDALNSGGAFAAVLFNVFWCVEYSGSTYFDPTSLGPPHSSAFLAHFVLKDIAVTNLIQQVGNTTHQGRLAPGSYIYFYSNSYDSTAESGYATTLVNSLYFQTVPFPIVTQHPQDVTVSLGSTASFSVGTSPGPASTAQAALTLYQWRRNNQNLVNGGRISGATGNMLQMSSTVLADSGYYDCLVTRDGVEEPSSLAHLVVTTTTSVGPAPGPAGLALSTPAPNPFALATRIRYALPQATEVWLDVVDLAGRRIRELDRGGRLEAGSHEVEWDGRSQRGDRVPSGIYFIRLRAGSEQRVQRVVRFDE